MCQVSGSLEVPGDSSRRPPRKVQSVLLRVDIISCRIQTQRKIIQLEAPFKVGVVIMTPYNMAGLSIRFKLPEALVT